MNTIYKKMKYKEQAKILVLNLPDDVREIIEDFPNQIDEAIEGKYGFIIMFAKELRQATKNTADIIGALEGDGHIWLCYPKGTSKKYKSDIKRDIAWDLFKPYGYRPVSQISINDDWSAMRFRDEKFVKTTK